MVSVPARLAGRLDSEMQAAHGISLRDYEVLIHLSEADGAAMRMVELADRLVVSPSGLTRRLDGLVRDGLVRRQACLSDRRGTLAVLSAAGRAALEEAAPTHVSNVRRFVFEALSGEQVHDLTACLRLMSAVLDVADDEGTQPTPAASTTPISPKSKSRSSQPPPSAPAATPTAVN
jgi:DNA-binding MarR family transcriptional regulator